jgi:cytoskeleton protein RodZ
MTSAAPGPDVRGIGARLRAARERTGLTVLQAAEKLHVDARVLEALEAEDFAALGADVYVRGHLRRYADLVGERPEALQELYAGTRQAARPDLTRIPRSEPPGRSTRLLLPALLLVVGCALAGLLWWFLSLPGEKARPLAPAPPASTAVPADGGAPADTTGAAASPSGSPAAAGAGRAGVAATAGAARLELTFSGGCWVEISDADGRRLLHGLIEGGGVRTLVGIPPLAVVLGNSPVVTLQLNGRPVSFADLVHRDGSAHLLIDAAGRATLAPARLARGE